MKLIENKKTEYVILVPKDKDVFIDFAVKELNGVIEKSTGVKFEVVDNATENFISIGNTSALKNAKIIASYGDDGYAVKEKDGNLYLFGHFGCFPRSCKNRSPDNINRIAIWVFVGKKRIENNTLTASKT